MQIINNSNIKDDCAAYVRELDNQGAGANGSQWSLKYLWDTYGRENVEKELDLIFVARKKNK